MANFNLPHTFHDGTSETASGAQVSEDLEVLKERIEALENERLKGTGGTYATTAGTAPNVPVNETEYEPSSTRTTVVALSANSSSNAAIGLKVTVGGVVIHNTALLGYGEVHAGELAMGWPVVFIVPPGAKFKVNLTGTGAHSVEAHYLVL